MEKSTPSNPVESNIQSKTGIEDLFKDLTLVTPPILEKPQKDMKNDIMNLFEKVCHSTLLMEFSERLSKECYCCGRTVFILVTKICKSAESSPNNLVEDPNAHFIVRLLICCLLCCNRVKTLAQVSNLTLLR